jgi:hypothetical protein
MTAHHQSRLSADLVSRIHTVKTLVDEVYPKSIEDWLEGFELDGNPEGEVFIWECMAFTYAGFLEGRLLNLEQKNEVLGVILSRSLGRSEDAVLNKGYAHLSAADVKEVLGRYSSAADTVYAVNQHRTGA